MLNGRISFSNARVTVLDKSILDELAVNSKELNDRIKSIFKVDLLMYAFGDLFPRPNNTLTTDLDVITGVYNYAQQITHRLMTTRGYHPEDENVGVPWNNYIGQTYINKTIVTSSLIQDITDEVYKDSRTNRVIEVSAEFANPNTVAIQCVLEPVYIKTSLVVGFNVVGQN